MVIVMGCYFCLPSEKNESKVLEFESFGGYEIRVINCPQRLYTVREEQHETSECSENKVRVE